MGVFSGALGGAGVTIVIRAVDDFSKNIKKANTGFGKLGSIAGGVLKTGMMAAAAAVAAVGAAGLKTGRELEQANIAFTTMLGSGAKAEKMLSELVNFAKKTPFTLPGIVTASKQLLAMGAATEENMIPTLKMLGDVSAGVGGDMQRIARNFGQVATQGKLTGRDLKDFAIQGVPLIAQLADQFGVTKGEIQSMTSAGKIGFADVEEAFASMSGEGGKFFNLMDKQSLTLTGRLSNLQDILMVTASELVGVSSTGKVKEGGLFDTVATQVENLVELIDKYKDSVKVAFAGAKNVVMSLVDSVKAVFNQFKETFSLLKRDGMDAQTLFDKLGWAFDQIKIAWEAIALHLNVVFRVLEKTGVWDAFLWLWEKVSAAVGLVWEGIKGLIALAANLGNKIGLVTDEEFNHLAATLQGNTAAEIRIAMEEKKLLLLEEEVKTQEEINKGAEDHLQTEQRTAAILANQLDSMQAMRRGMKNTGANAAFFDQLSAAERTLVAGGKVPDRLAKNTIDTSSGRYYGTKNDFISRPGQGVANFSPNDTIIGVKDTSSIGGRSININIDSVQGLDPSAVAESLQRMLSRQITI